MPAAERGQQQLHQKVKKSASGNKVYAKNAKPLKNVTSKNCKSWDSIAQMTIVMEIEENFKIQLTEKDIYSLNTVEKIKKFLKKKK